MRIIYGVVQDYGLTLIIFILIIKAIQFPLNYKMQENNAKQRALKPRIEALRKQYANDNVSYNREQFLLQEKAEINPSEGMLLSIINMVLLYGMIGVIYKPLTYMANIDSQELNYALKSLKSYFEIRGLSTDTLSSQGELTLISYVKSNPELFTQGIVDKVGGFNSLFLNCIDLSKVPSFSESTLLIIPIVSALIQIINSILSIIQSKEMDPENVNIKNMYITSTIMTIFSIWLSFGFPSGIGLYWLLGNIIGLIESQVFYLFFNRKNAERVLEKTLNSESKKKIFYYEFFRFMQEKTKAQERQNKRQEIKTEKLEFYRVKIDRTKEILQEKYGN
jgi:YidC/Oxa1 family membrane protein insertase